MKTYRFNASMTGALYLLGTILGVTAAITGGSVFSSLVAQQPLEGFDLLQLVSENASQLNNGAFFTLLMGLSLSAMTLFLYPVLRKDSEELAMGMVLFRGAFEGVWYMISALGFIALVLLGNEYAVAGEAAGTLQPIGNALYGFLDMVGPVGTIMFLVGATCLYISFYRTKLIPRWLTIWGLIGVVPYFAYAVLHYFHMDDGIGFYLQMVLAPQELVMGIWLLVKGFNKEAVANLPD